MNTVSKSLTETRQIAKDFLNKLEISKDRATLIALEGDLGAGKTSFVQQIGQILGINDYINSPTFVIEKVYPINFHHFRKLIHIDAYRLEKDSELLHLGWEEILKNPENLVLIEWPENVSSIIPPLAKRVKFKFIDDSTREISYE